MFLKFSFISYHLVIVLNCFPLMSVRALWNCLILSDVNDNRLRMGTRFDLKMR